MPKILKQKNSNVVKLSSYLFMESEMANKKAATTYKENDQEYIEGIETPHGRIKILYETVISNIDKLTERHPKTDYISFGKCINALKILSSSLDAEKGKELAKNLEGLYGYCADKLREYLEDKNDQKIVEVRNIISGLLEAWEQIRE